MNTATILETSAIKDGDMGLRVPFAFPSPGCHTWLQHRPEFLRHGGEEQSAYSMPRRLVPRAASRDYAHLRAGHETIPLGLAGIVL